MGNVIAKGGELCGKCNYVHRSLPAEAYDAPDYSVADELEYESACGPYEDSDGETSLQTTFFHRLTAKQCRELAKYDNSTAVILKVIFAETQRQAEFGMCPSDADLALAIHDNLALIMSAKNSLATK